MGKRRTGPNRAYLAGTSFQADRFVEYLAHDLGVNLGNEAAIRRYPDDVPRFIDGDSWLLSQLASKFPFKGNEKLTRDTAISTFFETERLCLDTNFRLRNLRNHKFSCGSASAVFYRAQVKIGNVLAELSREAIFERARFSPGATYCLPRRKRDHLYKVASVQPSATHSLESYGPLFSQTLLSDLFSRRNTVRGNRVTTVPKNAKTDRLIALEPLLNAYLQKGAGSYLRSSLAYHSRGTCFAAGSGYDGQEHNRRLAQKGSLNSSLATIDLSKASDTISYGLILELLPFEAFCLLDELRSPVSEVDGKTYTLEKFASMGCGFTFELETLIFWALTSAVADMRGANLNRTNFGVYGDDIIVPCTLTNDLREVFEFCGFSFNTGKTYSSSSESFRESCGGHYSNGFDVTPFYLRHASSVWPVSEVAKLQNAVLFYCIRRYGFLSAVDLVFPRSWSYIQDCLKDAPMEFPRNSVPVADGSIFDSLTPRRKRQHRSYDGTEVRVLIPDMGFFISDHPALLAKALSSPGSTDNQQIIVDRPRFCYRTFHVLVRAVNPL